MMHPVLTLVAFHGILHFSPNKFSSPNYVSLYFLNRDQVVYNNVFSLPSFIYIIPFATPLGMKRGGFHI